MHHKTILLHLDDGVARLTLNRPERLNAFNMVMHEEVNDALDRIVAGSARVMVLTGAGRGFCAGQDLSERRSTGVGAQPDLGASLDECYNPLVRRLAALPLPVVCAVNGVAAGAGANIALACDIVIAKSSASFIQSFAKIGLVPDAGGTWSLPRLAGQARALGLALLGDPLGAQDAERWGLIWRAVPDEDYEAEVEGLVALLAKGPTQALAAAKAAIRGAWDRSLSNQLDVERDMQRRLGWSADYAEGVAAFVEKRVPVFRGQ